MESRDNITEQFKKAADRAASGRTFPGMDKVWAKVEERLDAAQPRRKVWPFRNVAIAAALLLFIGLGITWYLLPRTPQSDAKVQYTLNPALPASHVPLNDSVVQQRVAQQSPAAPAIPEQKIRQSRNLSQPESRTDEVAVRPAMNTQPVNGQATATYNAGTPGYTLNEVAIITPSYVEKSINMGSAATVSAVEIQKVPTKSSDFLSGLEYKVSKTFSIGKIHKETVPVLQDRTITGKITDENGEGLPGASVVIKGTNTGTVTDADGNYKLQLPASFDSLVVAATGTNKKTVAIGNRGYVPVIIPPSATAMNDIDIYGKKLDKRSYTGSLTTVTAADVAKRPVTDLMKALDGSAPGAQINEGGGQPGSTHDIQIRGIGSLRSNDASLIVVDGVPFNGKLEDIDPATIESITYLNGAEAAALYGSVSPNDAIKIVTKEKKKGSISEQNDITQEKAKHGFFKKTFHKVTRIFRKK